ncbi:MAG: hypothetical protein WCC97_14410 [Candidatus Acidiferrales bacterium]
MSKETGTTFTPATTNHGNAENGMPGLPLMSDAGKKLASVSAPSNAYEVRTSSTSAVKE